jgi:broad specificity phosphatase PhoE
MKLYITRHGTTEWNLEKRLQGWADSPLTEDGRNRAIKLGNSLKDIDFDMIYTSPQERALNTAKLIRGNKNTEIKVHNGLKELRYGSWQGMYISDIEKDYPADYHSYINDPEQYMPEDGESMVDLFQRVNLFLEEISTMNYQNILIVSHGITIKAIIAIIKELSWQEFASLEIYTGTALNVCELKDGSFEFLLEGDISHL